MPAGATGSHKSYFLTVGSSGLRWGCDVWAHKVLEGQVAGGMIRVQSVAPDSLGAELGLAPGTELLAVNGRPLEDFLDWEFLTADDRFVLAARMATGEEIEFDIERPEGLPLGVTLEPPRIRRCGNHCDFCFVDGNPAGLRSALYVRDDDYRLSFRYGNFATLTNLKPWDTARIVEYRLSPLYVSVHATDLTVRRWLLRNPEAPDIIPQLRWFAERGIAFHAQVVLVPEVNDGTVLERTLDELYGLGTAVLSVSVVPVALTEFSKRELVGEPTRAECRAALALVDRTAERALAGRTDLDFVLLPAEAVNDDLVFIDDVGADELAARVSLPLHLSYDFADVLGELGTRNAERGTGALASRSAFPLPRSAFGVGQG